MIKCVCLLFSHLNYTTDLHATLHTSFHELRKVISSPKDEELTAAKSSSVYIASIHNV